MKTLFFLFLPYLAGHTSANYNNSKLYTGWFYVVDETEGVKIQDDKTGAVYYINPKPIVTEKNFTSFEVFEEWYDGKPICGVSMEFDKKGTKAFGVATKKAMHKKLAFILFSKPLTVPEIQGAIVTGKTKMFLRGYTKEELEEFKKMLQM